MDKPTLLAADSSLRLCRQLMQVLAGQELNLEGRGSAAHILA